MSLIGEGHNFMNSTRRSLQDNFLAKIHSFITSLSSFSNLKKKTAGVLSKIISEMAKLHTAAILM